MGLEAFVVCIVLLSFTVMYSFMVIRYVYVFGKNDM